MKIEDLNILKTLRSLTNCKVMDRRYQTRYLSISVT